MAINNRLCNYFVPKIKLGCLLTLLSFTSQANTGSPLHIRGMLDVQLQTQNNGTQSWLNDGASGLRFSNNDSALQLTQVGLDISYRLTPTLKAKTTLLAYTGDEAEITPTEVFLHYRPVPSSQWRQEWRVGMFHLPMSLENRGPLWSSPYSLNSSTINTWLGEEMRTIGAEGRWTLPGKFREKNWDLAFIASVYGYNDTAGTLLAWRGWAQHDRIAGIRSSYSIAPLPQVGPGGLFEQQKQRYEPFVETDHKPGFYLGSELALGERLARGRKLKLSYFYYNNRAKSTAVKGGQYGWRTRFQQLSAHWRMTNSVEILGQILSGDTLMGAGPTTSIEADFWAAYALISKRWGPHRATLRWDRFEVEDLDQTPRDTNDEHGHSLMLGYSYNWGKGWKASLNLTRWQSERPGRHYIPSQPSNPLNTQQLQLSLRRYF